MRTNTRALLVVLLIFLAIFWFLQIQKPERDYDITFLSGITALSAHEVWSVGGVYYTGTHYYQPLIEYWDGIRWSVLRGPSFTTSQTLSAVKALSAHDVWAVGTVIEHWDGNQWHLVTNSPGELSAITAIAANNIWAVGLYPRGSVSTHMLIMHWDGISWKVVSSPYSGPGDSSLSSITAVSATDIWAVGNVRTPSTGDVRPLIEHWDGSTWRIVPVPDLSPSYWTSNALSGVTAIAGDNVWAVGTSSILTESQSQPLSLHWNGSTWQQITGPCVGRECYMSFGALAAISASDIWAVGVAGLGSNQTLIAHWDGQIWSRLASPSPKSVFSSVLQAIAAISPHDIWAVGTAELSNISTRQFIEHWDGTAWQLIEAPL